MNFASADVSGPPLALTMMLLVLGLGTGIAVWAVTQAAKHRRHSETLRVQAELQLKLLDKVSTSDELRGFLNSEPARRLFEGHLQAERSDVQTRFLGSLVPGCVLTPAGLVLISLGHDTLRFIGALCLAMGVGYLMATGIAYRVVRTWDRPARTDDRP